MSKTASIGISSSNGLFAHLVAIVDNFLTKSANIAVRNGDLPRFGL